ncbi:MAG TPA: hypothetical protein VHC45_06740 [Gaiellaceae bacterium]|jgi:hypothetical protein|nr:hypothetical protein [Gaiellaceae bacterium]
MLWYLLPVFIIGGALVVAALLLGVLAFLSRFRNGALLRPMIARLSRIALFRRFFQRISTAAMERQNPDLAGAVRKMSSVAQNPNPQAVQKAMSRLSPAERRAYLQAMEEQGGVPDAANRQMRRQAERMQQQARSGGPARGDGSGSTGRPGAPKRKRKR